VKYYIDTNTSGACLQGGIYVVELIDKFTLAFPLLIVVLLELIVISYIYGRTHRNDVVFKLSCL